jgi:hypothetical protein
VSHVSRPVRAGRPARRVGPTGNVAFVPEDGERGHSGRLLVSHQNAGLDRASSSIVQLLQCIMRKVDALDAPQIFAVRRLHSAVDDGGVLSRIVAMDEMSYRRLLADGFHRLRAKKTRWRMVAKKRPL